MPDFNLHSRFDPKQNFKAVKFGRDAKLLEVELNEVQEIIQHREKRVINSLYPDGIFPGFQVHVNAAPVENYYYEYRDIVGCLEGEFFEIEALQIDMKKYTVGTTIYLKKSEAIIKHTDTVPILGYTGDIPPNRNGIVFSKTVPNTLYDSRINEETSRRVQTQFTLTTNPGEGTLEFGQIVTSFAVDSKAFEETFTKLTYLRDLTIPEFYDIDGGSFTDAPNARMIDGGYFHKDVSAVMDGGEL